MRKARILPAKAYVSPEWQKTNHLAELFFKDVRYVTVEADWGNKYNCFTIPDTPNKGRSGTAIPKRFIEFIDNPAADADMP